MDNSLEVKFRCWIHSSSGSVGPEISVFCGAGSSFLWITGLTGMGQHEQTMELSLCLKVHHQAPLFTDAHARGVERTYMSRVHKSGNTGDQGLIICSISSKFEFRYVSSLSILAKDGDQNFE